MLKTDDKNFIKRKPVKSIVCSMVGHNMILTDEVSVTHEMGNNKILGYAGRTKEIKTRHKCERCNKAVFKTVYVEMDTFDSDMVPEHSIENPMTIHLKNVDAMKEKKNGK